MSARKVLGLGGVLCLAVALLGAAAQVSREEFEELQKKVTELEKATRYNKANMGLLKGRIERLEEHLEAQSKAQDQGARSDQRRTTPAEPAGEEIRSGGFSFRNITYRAGALGGSEFIGEVTNKSGKSYTFVSFTLSVYDLNGKLIDTTPVLVTNIQNGQTKSFSADFLRDLPSHIKYKIDFENDL